MADGAVTEPPASDREKESTEALQWLDANDRDNPYAHTPFRREISASEILQVQLAR